MGINCQDVRRDVSDYIDDELNPAQRAALDRHFAECRDCAALLDGMRNLIAIYGYERVLAPPDGFHERLYQKLEKETKSSRRTFLAWTLVAAAAELSAPTHSQVAPHERLRSAVDIAPRNPGSMRPTR